MIENFRDAARGLGKYCAVENEVTVRKGCKIYRLTCGKGWIRVSARSRPEIVIHLAPDATVSELKRFFTNVIDSPDFLYGTGEKPPSLDLVFLVKTKKPQTIRVTSKPADTHRKRRVIALLETAVEGIASNRHHPQPGMKCSWCQYRTECLAWLPGMTAEEVRRVLGFFTDRKNCRQTMLAVSDG